MLSLIICSVNPQQLADIKENISATIGVPYELLAWDNSQSNFGLCAVYNKMAEGAKFPFLVFLHEDLIFETHNWGALLLEIFRSPVSPKLIGVAGGRYKGRTYSGWFSGISGTDYYHIYHQDSYKKYGNSNKTQWLRPEVPVCCIDGVFMAVDRTVWQQVRFDDLLLTGFHFYDLDFSLRVQKQYPVVVTNRIDITHLTLGGDYGDRWVHQANVFHSAWRDKLPVYLGDKIDIDNAEKTVAKTWLRRLKGENIQIKNRVTWVRQQRLYKNPAFYLDIIAFLAYKPVGMHTAILKLKKLKRTLTNKS